MDKKKRKITKQDKHHINNIITLTDAIMELMDGYLKLENGVALTMAFSILADKVPAREDWPEAIVELAEWFTSTKEPLSLHEIAHELATRWENFTARFSDRH